MTRGGHVPGPIDHDLTGKVFGVVVGALTFDNDRVLLLRRSMRETFLPGQWTLPAGKVEYGEDLEEAVLRELYEEAGISGRVEGLTGVSWFKSRYRGHDLQWIQFNYRVAVDDSRVELRDGSNIDHYWLPIVDLDDPPMSFDDFTRQAIDTAIDTAIGTLAAPTPGANFDR